MEDTSCGRQTDLVGFLYGEIDQTEKLGFQGHLQSCAECKSQLASFTDVRASVVAWRNESLGSMISSVETRQLVMDSPKPSALAALRAFFNLSPLWVKGTVGFASLVFCLLAGLAVSRFNQIPPANNVASNNVAKITQEFDAQVEQKVKEELQRRRAATAPPVNAGPEVQSNLPQSPANKMKRSTLKSQTARIARPLSKLERQELAADLRLIEDDGETGLVLISDQINQ